MLNVTVATSLLRLSHIYIQKIVKLFHLRYNMKVTNKVNRKSGESESTLCIFTDHMCRYEKKSLLFDKKKWIIGAINSAGNERQHLSQVSKEWMNIVHEC